MRTNVTVEVLRTDCLWIPTEQVMNPTSCVYGGDMHSGVIHDKLEAAAAKSIAIVFLKHIT